MTRTPPTRIEPDGGASLSVVGGGLDPGLHLTLAGLRALRSADEVVSIMPAAWLAPIRSELRACTSYWSLYKAGRLRRDVYREYTSTVLSLVAEGKRVAHLCPGDPSWYDSITTRLIEETGDRYPVSVVPGISAVDALLADLRIGVAPGIAVVDAASVLAELVDFDTRLPLIVVQPHVALTAHVATSLLPTAEVLARLAGVLGRSYPRSHAISIVVAQGAGPPMQPSWTATIADLRHAPPELIRGASFVLGPVGDPRFDEATVEAAEGEEALAAHYRQVG